MENLFNEREVYTIGKRVKIVNFIVLKRQLKILKVTK